MVDSRASSSRSRLRRWAGWGFEGVRVEPSEELLAWLEDRLGPTKPTSVAEASEIHVPASRDLPDLPGEVSREPFDRLVRARGQGLPDLLRLRTGALPALPDAVVRVSSDRDLERLLRGCAQASVRLIPRGGGTSVTGGVNVLAGDSPTVVLDLTDLTGLETLDETSGLATFAAGTTGPQVEAAPAGPGLTLGHFPQPREPFTPGGRVATPATPPARNDVVCHELPRSPHGFYHLQHPLPALEPQRLADRRDDPRLGDRLPLADRQRRVGVGAGAQPLRDEELTGDAPHRREHALVGDLAATQLALDHLRPKRGEVRSAPHRP